MLGIGRLPASRGILSLASLLLFTLLGTACRDEGLIDPAPTAEATASARPSLTAAAAPSQLIPGRYIVTFRGDVTDVVGLTRQLVSSTSGTLRFTYTTAVKGFAADLPAQALEGLRHNPHVAGIEPDQIVQASGDFEVNAPWGLDRIDQRDLPLDGQFLVDRTGAGVTIYIVDTGIRYDHVDLGGRAVKGYDALGGDGSDCYGHGTHVAGIAAGLNAGVAKASRLVSVRVLDCNGQGSVSGIVAGLDWIAAQGARPAVANLSLGGGASDVFDAAINRVLAVGVSVSVAAGNANREACEYSPARVPGVLTVGATDTTDGRASFSNWGDCLDLFAPGVAITSAFYTSPTATKVWSGTSMAAPHVTGAVAKYLEGHPIATPAEVNDSILAYTTKSVVRNAWSTARHLLYTRPIVQRDTAPPLPPPAAPYALGGSSTQQGKNVQVNLSWTEPNAAVAYAEMQRKLVGGTYETIGWTFDGWSQYLDPYVSGGKTYVYRVRSYTGTGTTAWSNETTVSLCGKRSRSGC
jgi:aqualysin 1